MKDLTSTPHPQTNGAAFSEEALAKVRADFPILQQQVHGKALVYLDNAATAQKPSAVIDAMADFYRHQNANIHRGVHFLSMQATRSYDDARARVARALGAEHTREVIFVRSTTEAINLVAHSFLRPRLKPGDEILVTEMEHHANIIPWQLIAEPVGAKVVAAPISDSGQLDLEALTAMLSERTMMIALTQTSNVLGTVNPVESITKLAHDRGIPVLADGAQAMAHGPVDVRALGADFYTFSGHKVYGPDGIGVLYGKQDILSKMPPYQGGGDMIESVSFEGSTFRSIPERFEAGTPNISAAIGLARAFDYLEDIGWERIQAQEATLLAYATEQLQTLEGIQLHGTAPGKAAVISFALSGVHPHDVGTFLDMDGIAIRVGHHCAQPLMDRLGVSATTRASFAFYNTKAEVDVLVDSLRRVQSFFN
jgi:cysteine desulfurase/selenocysteine lyase